MEHLQILRGFLDRCKSAAEKLRSSDDRQQLLELEQKVKTLEGRTVLISQTNEEQAEVFAQRIWEIKAKVPETGSPPVAYVSKKRSSSTPVLRDASRLERDVVRRGGPSKNEQRPRVAG